MSRLNRIALALLLCGQGLCWAQAPPGVPTFNVSRFVVEGATLMSAQRIAAVLQPFTGSDRSVADLQAARAALESAYARLGYGAAQVLLPEQEILDGVIRLEVVEGRLGATAIEGNEYSSDANVRRSLPALVAGEPLNTDRLAANLRLANESPVKQTTVVLKPGAAAGAIDAEVRVADQRPWRVSVGLDNTGTPQSGQYRIGFGFQHANLFDRDHVLTMQYATSPSREDDPDKLALPPNDNVRIFGAGYRIPLPRLGDSIDLVAGYANVNSGVVQSLFSISGSGRIYAARYNFGLPRMGALEHKLAPGIDRRYYDNSVVPVGGTGGLVPDYVVTPLGLTWSGVARGEGREFSFSLGVARNLPGAANGDQVAFDAVRPGASARYSLGRLTASYVQALPRETQGRLRFSAQYTRDELVPGEQFGIGGMDSVRGFFEREFAGDKGYAFTAELYSQDLGPQLRVDGLRVRVLAFYDYGRAERVRPEVFEAPRVAISSVGPGIRVAYKTNFTLRADYGFRLQTGAPDARDHGRWNFSLAWVF